MHLVFLSSKLFFQDVLQNLMDITKQKTLARNLTKLLDQYRLRNKIIAKLEFYGYKLEIYCEL
jgi:hypothetical protein